MYLVKANHAALFLMALGLTLAVAATGCDDGEGDGSDGNADAAPPAVDASIPVPDASPPDASPPDASPPDAAPVLTGVEIQVTYTGPATGTLLMAVFTSNPPAGAPSGYAQQATPTFPATMYDDLAPGEYFVLVLLDAAPASNPQTPGPEDRLMWTDKITITAGAVTKVAVTLLDPT